MTKVQNTEIEGQRLKDLKAKNYLFQAIDQSILETILCKETSKQIWDSMKKKYLGSVRAKRQQLQALHTEFEMFRMKSGESVVDYFSRMMAIVNKMRIHGDKMEDVTVIEKILRSLTPKFNYVVCSIEESKDLDDLSMDELQGSLLAEEEEEAEETRIKEANNNSNIKSLKITNFMVLNGEEEDEVATKDEATTKDEVVTIQPISEQCQQTSPRSNATDVIEKEEEVSLLMICRAKEETNKNLWYLDTGCSNHMCGDKSTFSDLDESFRDDVKFGDNSKVSVMGKGKVAIQTKGNSIHTISNVLFVPDLKTNLLSVGQLQEKGYEISIKDGV
ncbi:uncharacterized protein LOC132301327 [Cornus florida]|uniref:uncharacterized protein LOC132301327 n=1 Tax=Cornus florida TaxID=4283 RepID=UPI00289D1D41|nr:uncharacterized protein LOC132301327 [Cornus florida]